jgi:hypothetical protein
VLRSSNKKVSNLTNSMVLTGDHISIINNYKVNKYQDYGLNSVRRTASMISVSEVNSPIRESVGYEGIESRECMFP